ncbi:MAG: hypothetical protein ACOX74_05790 [Lachnospiraceae bacterium]|jgi:hypothetical protein
MNKRVSLTEVVAAKIVLAVLFALIYWMWARSDYQEWYMDVYGWVVVPTAAFLIFHYYRVRKYRKEGVDELAERNLRRCDAICLRLLTAAACLIALIGGIAAHVSTGAAYMMGWALVITLIALSVLRTVLFWVMDKKGV